MFIYFTIHLICSRHLQLLENDKLLLIVDDHGGNILVYLDSQQGMNAAVQRPPRKHLHRSKIGDTCIFTFDEVRRTLAVCETTKVEPSHPKALMIIDPTTSSFSSISSSLMSSTTSSKVQQVGLTWLLGIPLGC